MSQNKLAQLLTNFFNDAKTELGVILTPSPKQSKWLSEKHGHDGSTQ